MGPSSLESTEQEHPERPLLYPSRKFECGQPEVLEIYTLPTRLMGQDGKAGGRLRLLLDC